MLTLFCKRVFDVVCSLFLLLMLSPLLLIVAVAIKLESKGPVLFRQKRLGKNLEPFSMLKFRSMVENAEQIGDGLFSYENDFRITKVGNFIRKTSIDELPQLVNVLVGDMSLVGPRPPVTYELGPIDEFSDDLKARFRVKPGITGLAQVSGRNDLDWDEKIRMDNAYIENLFKKGFFYDFSILFKTVFIVLSMDSIVEKRK